MGGSAGTGSCSFANGVGAAISGATGGNGVGAGAGMGAGMCTGTGAGAGTGAGGAGAVGCGVMGAGGCTGFVGVISIITASCAAFACRWVLICASVRPRCFLSPSPNCW